MAIIPVGATSGSGGGGATDPPDPSDVDLTPDPEPEPEPAREPNRSERTPSNPFGDSGPTFDPDDGSVVDDNGSSTPMGSDPDGDGDTTESAAEDDAVGTIPDSDPSPPEDTLLHEDDAGRARAYVEDTTDPMDPDTTPGATSDAIEDANSDGDPSTTAVGAVESMRDRLDSVRDEMSVTERASELEAADRAKTLMFAAAALVVGAVAFAWGEN